MIICCESYTISRAPQLVNVSCTARTSKACISRHSGRCSLEIHEIAADVLKEHSSVAEASRNVLRGHSSVTEASEIEKRWWRGSLSGSSLAKMACKGGMENRPLESKRPDPEGENDEDDRIAKKDDPTMRWNPASPISITTYSSLSKLKLSAFVVLTSMAGYAMAPGILGPVELLCTTLGTGLCALSANTFNQWAETPFDSQMSRTRTRPLTKHTLSQFHAFAFAALTGLSGVAILILTVNYGIALIGFFNIILYSVIYTSLKRISIANTWVGAVVGALPPIMGWGATGDFFSAGPYILAGILFSWQFPHFCSLSWLHRADYTKAGYKMMSVLNPKLNARVSLRHSILMFCFIAASCQCGLTSNAFLIDGSLINLFITAKAYSFWRKQTPRTAKSLFFASLLHLPILVILMMIHKLPPERYYNFSRLDANLSDYCPSTSALSDEVEAPTKSHEEPNCETNNIERS